jgi:hypothetical protein
MSLSRLVRYGPAAGSIALVAGVAAWLTRASAQQDLAAYFVAGAARRAGQDPYLNHAGGPLWDGVAVFAHSRFLYPPLVAELFRPLAALPYPVAKALFTAASVAIWVAAAVASARLFDRQERPAWTLGASAVSFPLFIHLERGQIDLAVLALLLAAWTLRARPAAAGAALAAAALLKPPVAFVLPVVFALDRRRAAIAALAWAAVLATLTAAIAGPALLAEYATRVLPRAARYGEGGTEEMLLPPERRATIADAIASGTVTLGGARFPLAVWDGPLSASLPRLLAPDAPSPLAGILPGAAALVGLTAAARAVRRRARPPIAEALLYFAAAVASVVASPAGWVMGLVVALPMVPLAGAAALSPRARAGLVAALVACACPPPFAGWPALAGAAVVVAATSAAVAAP